MPPSDSIPKLMFTGFESEEEELIRLSEMTNPEDIPPPPPDDQVRTPINDSLTESLMSLLPNPSNRRPIPRCQPNMHPPNRELFAQTPNNHPPAPPAPPAGGVVRANVGTQPTVPPPAPRMASTNPLPPLPHLPVAVAAGVGSTGVAPHQMPVQPPVPAVYKKAASSKTNMRFAQEEVNTLLDIIGRILPIGKALWEAVEQECNSKFPNRPREHDNLRRQFNRHVNKKVPTGNPNVPPHAKLAKEISKKIHEKADCVKFGDGDEEEPLADDLNGIGTTKNQGTQTEAKAAAESSGKGNGKAHSAARKNPPGLEAAAVLKAHLETEKMSREAADRRDRKEARREKRREKKEQKHMQMMMTFMTGALQAITNNNSDSGKKSPPVPHFLLADTTESESDEPTPGHHRRSRRRKKRIARKKKELNTEDSSLASICLTSDSEDDKKPPAKKMKKNQDNKENQE